MTTEAGPVVITIHFTDRRLSENTRAGEETSVRLGGLTAWLIAILMSQEVA